MRYAPIHERERACWSLAAAGAQVPEVAERLGVSRDRARCELYGAASALIREWQRRQSRAFLRRLFGQAKTGRNDGK